MLLYASLPAAAWLGVLTTWQVGVAALLAGIANVFFATQRPGWWAVADIYP